MATEIFQNSNFIELHPTDKDIWAVNSLRQLLVCKDFKNRNEIQFETVNEVYNVMKAAIGNKHQVIIKIVKQLDELMIRDPDEKQEKIDDEEMEPFEIPMPASCMLDGVSISG